VWALVVVGGPPAGAPVPVTGVEEREEKPDDAVVGFAGADEDEVAVDGGGGRLSDDRMRSCFASPREMRLRIWDMLGATGGLAGGLSAAMAMAAKIWLASNFVSGGLEAGC